MLQTQWPGKGEETAEQSKTSSLKAEIETVSVSQSSSKLITVTVKQLLYKQPIPLYTMEGFDREIKCNGNEGTSVYTPVLATLIEPCTVNVKGHGFKNSVQIRNLWHLYSNLSKCLRNYNEHLECVTTRLVGYNYPISNNRELNNRLITNALKI